MKKRSLIFLTLTMLALSSCKGSNVSDIPVGEREEQDVAVADSEEDDTGADSPEDIDETDESETSGGMFNTGNHVIDSMSIDLPDDREIESHGWVDDDERCYRVRIDYKEQPENAYKHVEDFFYYIDDDESVISVYVSYPDKDYPYSPRYVHDACDFDAKLEDITFDGHDDIVISLGHAGSHGDEVYCAYVYELGEFVYHRSFEFIPNPEVDAVNKRILSPATYNGEEMIESYRYNSTQNSFIYDYSSVDMQGLDADAVGFFEVAAIYLDKPFSNETGDALTSRAAGLGLTDFLFMTCFEGEEEVTDFEETPELCTQCRISYDDWAYAIKEVFGEENPENLRDALGTEYNGEFDVFYNPDDDCIYTCAGALGWGYESTNVRHVWKDGDTYVVLYDIFYEPGIIIEQAYVTIEEADNDYGYRLISIE